MPEYKLKVHEILQNYLREYIPSQELTFSANEFCKTINVDGTYSEDKLQELHSYLLKDDKEFIPLQTVRTKSITNNQVILAVHAIRNYLAEYKAAYVPTP